MYGRPHEIPSAKRTEGIISTERLLLTVAHLRTIHSRPLLASLLPFPLGYYLFFAQGSLVMWGSSACINAHYTNRAQFQDFRRISFSALSCTFVESRVRRFMNQSLVLFFPQTIGHKRNKKLNTKIKRKLMK